MAKLPIDLKHFKKAASDKHTTTLEHKDGHSIKLTHSALSKEMKAMLDKLPMKKMASGGTVEQIQVDPTEIEQEDGRMAEGGQVGMEAIKKEEYHAMPEDAIVGSMQEPNASVMPTPTPVVDPTEGLTSTPAQKAYQDALDMSRMSNPNMPEEYHQKFAQDAVIPGLQRQQNITQNQAEQQKLNAEKKLQEDVAFNDRAAQFGLPKRPIPESGIKQQVTPEAASQVANASLPAQSAAVTDPYGLDAQGQMYGAGMATATAGIANEADALARRGQAEAAALQNQLKVQEKIQSDYQQHTQDLEKERQAFQSDLQESHIDPNHYVGSMSTMGKIATAVGLILGGMGGGAGENPALKMLQYNIDKDIEAQKANLGKKENLLSANLKQFGNLRDATDMTRVMQNDIVINKLKTAAASATSPLAQSAALKAIGALEMQSAPMMAQIAQRKTMMSAMQGNQDPTQMGQVIQAMRMVAPEMAKSMEERYVPGVGMAQIPLPKEARDTIVAKQTLNKMANEFGQWAKANSGSLNPATINEGKAKAAELQSLYRNAINGGVFKKGEQEFIDQIVDSDPTKFFNNIRVLPKLNEVIRNNNAQMSILKKAYGIPEAQIQRGAPILRK